MNFIQRSNITVITVVRNKAPLLEATIKSVLEQRPKPDYIIVDGASTDGTLDVIRRYEDSLTRWASEADNGVYDAMNKGWVMANPESRILFLGAGDRLLSLPEAQPDDNKHSVLYGHVELDNHLHFHACVGLRLKLYNTLHHQALLVPKKIHPEPPFDLAFPNYADFDFNQRLQKSGAFFAFCPELSAYAAPGGLTDELHLEELMGIVHKNFGPVWEGLSRFCFAVAKRIPILRKLKPIY